MVIQGREPEHSNRNEHKKESVGATAQTARVLAGNGKAGLTIMIQIHTTFTVFVVVESRLERPVTEPTLT